MLSVQAENDLAVAAGLVGERSRLRSKLFVVVDLPVHSQRCSGIRIQQGLGSAGDINNRQSLVGEYRAFMLENARPIRATVPLPFGNGEGGRAEFIRWRIGVEDCCYGAHGQTILCSAYV